jgi:hypothetical protein
METIKVRDENQKYLDDREKIVRFVGDFDPRFVWYEQAVVGVGDFHTRVPVHWRPGLLQGPKDGADPCREFNDQEDKHPDAVFEFWFIGSLDGCLRYPEVVPTLVGDFNDHEAKRTDATCKCGVPFALDLIIVFLARFVIYIFQLLSFLCCHEVRQSQQQRRRLNDCVAGHTLALLAHLARQPHSIVPGR